MYKTYMLHISVNFKNYAYLNNFHNNIILNIIFLVNFAFFSIIFKSTIYRKHQRFMSGKIKYKSFFYYSYLNS